MTIAVAYLPVIHKGHVEFCQRVKPRLLYVLGDSIRSEFPLLERDIRALPPAHICAIARVMNLAPRIELLEKKDLLVLRNRGSLVFTDDEVMRHIAKKYFSHKRIRFVSAFLRWSKMAALTSHPISPDITVSKREADRILMRRALRNAERSSDWWRQVGSLVVRRGRVLYEAWNIHRPTEHAPYIDGDPRANFDAGEHPEIYTALHAEAGLIARAAEQGISLRGASIYVTTFPCPNCALLIIRAGIKKVYYANGYSNLNAQENLKLAGTEIIRVK